jgi:hypothetical protein
LLSQGYIYKESHEEKGQEFIHQVSYSIVEAKIQQAYKLFKDFSG